MINRELKLTDLFSHHNNDITHYLFKNTLTGNKANAALGNLSNTCQYFNLFFKDTLITNAVLFLYRAIIHHDEKAVKKILNKKLTILLFKSPSPLMIEHKTTQQKFYAENFLMMAVSRKQIKMIKLLLAYYNKLKEFADIQKIIETALLNWTYYETKVQPIKMIRYQMSNNKILSLPIAGDPSNDKIVIPEKYIIYAQSLLKNFIHSTLTPVILDTSWDAELLLLALYRMLRDNKYQLSLDEQSALHFHITDFIKKFFPEPESSEEEMLSYGILADNLQSDLLEREKEFAAICKQHLDKKLLHYHSR